MNGSCSLLQVLALDVVGVCRMAAVISQVVNPLPGTLPTLNHHPRLFIGRLDINWPQRLAAIMQHNQTWQDRKIPERTCSLTEQKTKSCTDTPSERRHFPYSYKCRFCHLQMVHKQPFFDPTNSAAVRLHWRFGGRDLKHVDKVPIES